MVRWRGTVELSPSINKIYKTISTPCFVNKVRKVTETTVSRRVLGKPKKDEKVVGSKLHL